MTKTATPANADKTPKVMQASIDFACVDPDCSATITFRLAELRQSNGRLSCPNCRRQYRFDPEFLDKLERLQNLIIAVQRAEDILGDANIAVTTSSGEVKIPYRLLLTRLNTIITLEVEGRKIEFNFRIEPLNNGSYR